MKIKILKWLACVGISALSISCGPDTSPPPADNKKHEPPKPQYSRYEFPERPNIVVSSEFNLSNLNRVRYEFKEPDFFVTKRFIFNPDADKKMNLGYVQTKVDGCEESGDLEVMYSWVKTINENSNTFETVSQKSWYRVQKDGNYQFVVSITNNGRCKQIWLDFWMTSDDRSSPDSGYASGALNQ